MAEKELTEQEEWERHVEQSLSNAQNQDTTMTERELMWAYGFFAGGVTVMILVIVLELVVQL